MKYDMVKPCINCPFRNDDTRITFYNRERAEEIEEQAFRQGFPCHTTAEHVEEDDECLGTEGGFYEGENTQHCAGFVIMLIKEGETGWPGLNNDEDLVESYAKRIGNDLWAEPVFDCTEDFFEANEQKTK